MQSRLREFCFIPEKVDKHILGFVERSSMSLSKNLRSLLNEKNLTVAQLARQSGVPAKTIYHWLNGQQPRKVDHLFKICDVLAISLDELYGREARKKIDTLPADLFAGVYEVFLRPASKRRG